MKRSSLLQHLLDKARNMMVQWIPPASFVLLFIPNFYCCPGPMQKSISPPSFLFHQYGSCFEPASIVSGGWFEAGYGQRKGCRGGSYSTRGRGREVGTSQPCLGRRS